MKETSVDWHTGKAGLWTHGLDPWTLDIWTLEAWMTGRLDSGRLDSGRLDAWTLHRCFQNIHHNCRTLKFY